MKNFYLKSKEFVAKYSKAFGAFAFALMGALSVGVNSASASFASMISDASTAFSTTTGFSYADLVSWAGDIILQILGGGLGLVDALIGWIIALVIIGVIVHLIFRGLRFLHILR